MPSIAEWIDRREAIRTKYGVESVLEGNAHREFVKECAHFDVEFIRYVLENSLLPPGMAGLVGKVLDAPSEEDRKTVLDGVMWAKDARIAELEAELLKVQTIAIDRGQELLEARNELMRLTEVERQKDAAEKCLSHIMVHAEKATAAADLGSARLSAARILGVIRTHDAGDVGKRLRGELPPEIDLTA